MVRYSALCKFPGWPSSTSRQTTSIGFPVHKFISPAEFCGELFVVILEILLAKFARRNANVLHRQASSYVSCLWKWHFMEVVNKVTIYHCLRSSFRLLVNFSRSLLTIKGRIYVQHLQACLLKKEIDAPPTIDFAFQLRWSVSKSLHSARWRNPVLHIPNAPLCVARLLFPLTWQESNSKQWASLLASSSLPSSHHFQPQAVSRECCEHQSRCSVFLLPFCHLQTAAIKSAHCLTACYQQCLLSDP